MDGKGGKQTFLRSTIERTDSRENWIAASDKESPVVTEAMCIISSSSSLVTMPSLFLSKMRKVAVDFCSTVPNLRIPS